MVNGIVPMTDVPTTVETVGMRSTATDIAAAGTTTATTATVVSVSRKRAKSSDRLSLSGITMPTFSPLPDISVPKQPTGPFSDHNVPGTPSTTLVKRRRAWTEDLAVTMSATPDYVDWIQNEYEKITKKEIESLKQLVKFTQDEEMALSGSSDDDEVVSPRLKKAKTSEHIHVSQSFLDKEDGDNAENPSHGMQLFDSIDDYASPSDAVTMSGGGIKEDAATVSTAATTNSSVFTTDLKKRKKLSSPEFDATAAKRIEFKVDDTDDIVMQDAGMSRSTTAASTSFTTASNFTSNNSTKVPTVEHFGNYSVSTTVSMEALESSVPVVSDDVLNVESSNDLTNAESSNDVVNLGASNDVTTVDPPIEATVESFPPTHEYRSFILPFKSRHSNIFDRMTCISAAKRKIDVLGNVLTLQKACTNAAASGSFLFTLIEKDDGSIELKNGKKLEAIDYKKLRQYLCRRQHSPEENVSVPEGTVGGTRFLEWHLTQAGMDEYKESLRKDLVDKYGLDDDYYKKIETSPLTPLSIGSASSRPKSAGNNTTTKAAELELGRLCRAWENISKTHKDNIFCLDDWQKHLGEKIGRVQLRVFLQGIQPRSKLQSFPTDVFEVILSFLNPVEDVILNPIFFYTLCADYRDDDYYRIATHMMQRAGRIQRFYEPVYHPEGSGKLTGKLIERKLVVNYVFERSVGKTKLTVREHYPTAADPQTWDKSPFILDAKWIEDESDVRYCICSVLKILARRGFKCKCDFRIPGLHMLRVEFVTSTDTQTELA